MRYDGLNIRTEYARICALPCWHPKVRDKHPTLDIVQVATPYLAEAMMTAPEGRPFVRQPPLAA